MNNLRNLRKAKGLSLADISKATGIPVRSLEDWDSEKRTINAYHRIKRLAKLLDVSVDEFMTKEEKCIYAGNSVALSMVQEENGVEFYIVDCDTFNYLLQGTIPREEALNLLKHLKNDKDITEYIQCTILEQYLDIN